MKKEVLSILTNQLKKNKFAMIILLIVFIALIIFSPFVSKLIDVTSFYYGNNSYNTLLSKSSPTVCENEGYFVNNDFLLQKNKIINGQCIMLKDNVDYSKTFRIKSLSHNEIIISKSIALNNNIKIGDYVDIDVNYNHKIVKYHVVGICDYLFDITQDINILASPIFFVGYDEEYINNSLVTYLSFYDKNLDVATIITVDNIIGNYQCNTRAIYNGFILTILMILNIATISLGYYFFSKSLEKESILKIIRNSGITHKNYRNFIFLIEIFSIIMYCLPLIFVTTISSILSIKYLYILALFVMLLIIYCFFEIFTIYKKNNFIGVKND